jgi:hypothetical protein
MSWFDVFMGLRIFGWTRERDRAKRDQRVREAEQQGRDLLSTWEDEHAASIATFIRLETEALLILDTDFQRTLKICDRIIEQDKDGWLEDYLSVYSEWGRRSAPVLERIAVEFQAMPAPILIEDQAAFLDIQADAYHALVRVAEGARLWDSCAPPQKGDPLEAGRVTQEGMDMWSALDTKISKLDGRPVKLRFPWM